MFSVRPYQRAAVDATLADLAAGRRRIACILPTGAGKTECMALTVAERALQRPHESVLILSHLSLLTTQTEARFRLRAPQLSVGVLQGEKRPGVMSDVVISTMQTARSANHIDQLKATLVKPVTLLVVDETHMLPTTSYQQIQTYFPDAQLVGYTATPFREKKLMTNFFDAISYTISLQELIDQHYLVPPVLREIIMPVEKDEHAEIMSIVSTYLTHEAGNKAIVYMRTIDDAKLLRNAFEACGVVSRAVCDDTGATDRQRIFDSFSSGPTDVLVSVDVLTAGFDAPCVAAIFMPYGTKSPTQYLQRVGRGLRPYAGKTSCRVYLRGDAPRVNNRSYADLNKMVLQAGRGTPTHPTFREDLELTYWPKGSETYTWTQTVVTIVEKMERLGMKRFAALLNNKAFPEQFLRSLTELGARLPDKRTSLPHADRPATDSQQSMLFDAGFPSAVISALTKGEASMMISTITNRRNDPLARTGEYVVTEGQHAGKHVSELPHAYRKIVLKKAPDSPVAQLITAWQSRNRRQA